MHFGNTNKRLHLIKQEAKILRAKRITKVRKAEVSLRHRAVCCPALNLRGGDNCYSDDPSDFSRK